MTPAPLNVFQRTQRLWDTIHPYNAAQAATLAERFAREAITDAFNTAIADLRLGRFVVHGTNYDIERGAARIEVEVATDLAHHLTAGMNAGFDRDATIPFRPFVVDGPDGQTIGIVYQHWVADSVSIRLLMRQWVLRLIGQGEGAQPVTLDIVGMRRRFGPIASGWSVVSEIAELVGFVNRMRKMRRIGGRDETHNVRVVTRTLPEGLIGGLLARSRREKLTVGDVFLAAAAEACTLGPNVASRRRPDLAIGTIVDLRSRAHHVPASCFGLFLGFMTGTFCQRSLRDFNTLLRRARSLRVGQSRRRSAEASQLRMWIGLAATQHLSRKRLIEFYRKRFPLAGGLSNVNLTPQWGALHPSPVRGYHRISPTGPLMPIVFTPTTLGRQLSLCCTYRTALMDEPLASELIDVFERRLTQYAS